MKTSSTVRHSLSQENPAFFDRESIYQKPGQPHRPCQLTGRIWAFLLVFTVVLAAPQNVYGQDEERKLRWELKTGDKLEAILNQETKIHTRLNNRSQKISNEMLLSIDWVVSTADEQTIAIEQSIRRVRLTINAPGKSGVKITTVDTDNDNEQTVNELATELLQQVQPIVGTKYSVTMNPQGKILSVEIPEESLEVIRQAPASMQIRKVITKEGLTELFGQSAVVFPDQDLKPGDTWETNAEHVHEVGAVTKTNRFQYKGRSTIDGTPSDVIEMNSTAILKNPNSATTLEQYSGSGRILFSAQSSKVVSSESKTGLTTRRKYRDKVIESTVETTISLTVNKK